MRIHLQKMQLQNWNLAQSNSHMLAVSLCLSLHRSVRINYSKLIYDPLLINFAGTQFEQR